MFSCLTAITVNIGKEQMEGLLQFFPTFLVDAVAKVFSFEGAFEEAYLLDFVQVLGYGGLGKANDIHKVVADAVVLFADILQNGNPGRVCHDLGNFCQLIVGCGKHIGFGGSHILTRSNEI
jgi:hypothetical protein